MTESTWLLTLPPLFPLLSFLLLIVFAKRLSWKTAAICSVGAMGLSALVSAVLVFQLQSSSNHALVFTLWHWFSLTLNESSTVNFAFYLDALSGVMISVVCGVGFLIHLFAAIYMREDANFSRFMAYMNLFIVAMLILVLADNLVLLYLGWEGVGLCSFLLIGFWYQEPSNVLAARKAFIVTRVGDTAMAIGLFMLFRSVGELTINDAVSVAQQSWQIGNDDAFWITLLLLGGAVGKSAQLPLQTWLPDAMAGPTPVSALIHAATMVTAGVYLIARMNGLFLYSPQVMFLVACVGGATLLLAGFAALTQHDIKRVLAYSTMSQIGYMMLGLGAGVWSASVLHLMTHAFFKALLFLTAGSIIYALHHQQNLFKMGGLLKRLPFESGLFIIGLLCLIAFPGTSGFFSKEAILAGLWTSPTAGPILWWCGVIGAFITTVYSCRLFFLAFLGHSRHNAELTELPKGLLRLSLVVLAILSLIGGLFPLDLSLVFPSENVEAATNSPSWLHGVAIATPFVGLIFSWFFFKKYHGNQPFTEQKVPSGFYSFFTNGLGFDALYRFVFIRPYIWLAKINSTDIIDKLAMLNCWYVKLWRDVFSYSQNSLIRWYGAVFGIGMIFLIGVVYV